MTKRTALILLFTASAAIPALAGPRLPGFRPPIPRPQVEVIQYYDSRDSVEFTAMAAQETVVPGEDMVIAVIFDHEPGWHIHTDEPVIPPELGEAEDYIDTEIHFDLTGSKGITVHEPFIQWPDEHVVEVAFGGTPVDYAVYEGLAIAYIPVTIAADAKPGEVDLMIRPVFQACDDTVCLAPSPRPGSSDWDSYGVLVEFNVVSLSERTTSTPPDPAIFDSFDPGVFARIHSGEAPPDIVAFDTFGLDFNIDASGWGLLLLLLVAAFGGFLLNLTPCVLPVIPLKIMALSGASEHRSRTLLLGIMMLLGIICFWLVLGGLIAGAAITAINQLFQYPAFTIAVGLFIGLMAIGMCGLFTIRLPGKLYMVNPKHDTIHGSFLFGIMTAILSTPCTAPFMGAAAAWATTESPAITMLVFAAIGLGMGLPYLVLAAFPQLTNKMPRAGAASELIKQVMGLLMLSAAAYFVGVGLSGVLAEPPQPPGRTYLWVVAGILMAAGLWLGCRTFQISRSWTQRSFFGGIGALLVAIGIIGGVELTDKGPISWVYYTPQRLQESLGEGDVVVIEFTAEWCLNCKALEQTVLASDEVVALFKQDQAVPMKVDLTGNNTVGNDLLAEVGGLRIPLLIVLAPDGREVFRGDFYTIDQVVDAVNDARGDT